MGTPTNTTTLPAAGIWVFDNSHTTVGFVAKHLMVTKVRGAFGKVSGTVVVAEPPEASQVDVTIDVASVTTGSPDRDGHLRSPDFFDAERFPEMRFVSTGVERHHNGWRMHGELTIKEVTRPLTLDFEFEGLATDPWGKPHAAFSARTEIDRDEWGLNWNIALEAGGWLVSKKITIEIETELVPSA